MQIGRSAQPTQAQLDHAKLEQQARAPKPTRLQQIMRTNREDEHKLVADQLQHFGMKVPTGADAARADEVGYVPVAIGTEVYRPGQNAPDVVVGVDGANLITKQRDSITGAVEEFRLPFSSYAEHSQSLMSAAATVDGFTGAQLAQIRAGEHTPKGFTDHLWAPTDASIDDVAAFGDQATVTLRHADAPKGVTPSDVQMSWGDWRNKFRQADALTPVAVGPSSVDHVQNLLWLDRNHHLIESALGRHNQVAYFDKPDAERPNPAARDRVIGTDVTPMHRGQPVLDRIDAIDKFFTKYVEAHGVMPKGRQVIGLTDLPDNLVNAYIQPMDRGRVELAEGPRPFALNQSLLHEVPSDARRQYRHINDLLRHYSVAVFGHEGDHVHQTDEWGSPDQRTDPQALSRGGQLEALEQSEVMEGFSDAAGDARTGKASVGVRDLGRVGRYEHTLGGLRALEARAPLDALDPHMGTQLVTQPLVAFGKKNGSAVLAEVLGAATRQIGTDLKEGRYDWADIPHAASGLHEAAARRLGADHPSVAKLRQEWGKLGVPLRDVKYGSWGEAATRVYGGAPVEQAMKLDEEQQVRTALDDLERLSTSKTKNSAAIQELTRVRSTEQGTRAMLTKPIAEMGRQHGWDTVATITRNTRDKLGEQLRQGRMDTVTMPDAARALRDATAEHFGGKYASPAVKVQRELKPLIEVEQLKNVLSGLIR